jgi:hypothetical protein
MQALFYALPPPSESESGRISDGLPHCMPPPSEIESGRISDGLPHCMQALFYEALDEMRAHGRLPGAVQGKSSYTPAVHAHAQVRALA